MKWHESGGMTTADSIEPAFGAAIGRLGPALLSGLDSLEKAFRRLHPPDFASLRSRLVPVRDGLDEALMKFLETDSPEGLEAFRDDLTQAAELTREALSGLAEEERLMRGDFLSRGLDHR